MSLRLSGINPLSYMGVEPSQPPNLLIKSADPTANDFQNINVGTFWLVYPDQRLWVLISVVGGTATWVQLYPAGGGSGASQFPTNSGIANESGGMLNILGDGNVVTSGAGDTVTISMAGDFVENFVTDSGTATVSSNTIRVLGGINMNTAASGNTITVNLNDSVGLGGTLDVVGAVTLPSDTNGVLQTNNTGVVSATNGTNGQLLIGGGTAPSWANLTSTGGTVIITNAPNAINLESTGGGGGGAGSVAFYAYQASNYGVPNVVGTSPVSYTWGTGLALTVNINEGAAFFPGDGVGTPASFTAPVNGIYYIEVRAKFLAGYTGSTDPISPFVDGCIQIITPDLIYAGVTGQVSQNILGNVASAWFGNNGAQTSEGAACHVSVIVQLNATDVVTFNSIANKVVTVGTGSAYTICGPITPIFPGTSSLVTFIQGYILKVL